MKKTVFALCAAVLIIGMCLCGCASNPTPVVKRVSTSTTTDLSGYWNDTDVRIVADSLADQVLHCPAILQYWPVHQKLPVVIVGTFSNESDEHIDTSILSKKFESALINSGRVEFVANAQEREAIRQDRIEQQEWTSESSRKALRNETGADYILIGSVKAIVDWNTKDMTRVYYVYAELIDLETNKKLWIGENNDIKKIISRK